MSLTDKLNDAISGGRSQAFFSDGYDEVLLNTVLNYKESSDGDVSSHAIEEGANIEDHVSSNPKTYSISVIFSDDDLDLLDPTGFTNLTIEDRLAILDAWKENKLTLTYYGHEFDVEDVVLTSISKGKTSDSGSGWEIDIDFQVITVASYMTASFSTNPTENQNAVSQKGATTKGKDTKAGSPTTGKSNSILSGLVG